ncbi:hypothetical protein [Dysgonomonas sp. 520]|nr:hypothetical protein [Dysgonomonas sp. 520]
MVYFVFHITETNADWILPAFIDRKRGDVWNNITSFISSEV